MGAAHAGTAVQTLFATDLTGTLISDNSAETFIDVNGDGTVDTGDIIFGIVGFNTVSSSTTGGTDVAIGQGSTYNELTAIEASVILDDGATISDNPQGVELADYYAGGLTATETPWFDWSTGKISFSGCLDVGCVPDATFNTAFGATNDGENFLLLFEDAANDYTRVGDGTLQSTLDSATGGTERLLLSIDPANGDYLFVRAPTTPADIPTDVPTFDTALVGTSIGADTTAAAQNFPGLLLTDNVTAGTGGFATPSDGSPYLVNDNLDMTIYAQTIPEPGSIALLAAGLIGSGFASRRRARK
jgi:hypothetical protein